MTSALPIHSAVPTRPSPLASDYVSVVVHHDQRIKLPSATRGGSREAAVVPVTVKFMSTASIPLLIDIEAIESFVLKRSGTAGPNSSGTSSASLANAAFVDDAFSSSDSVPILPVKGIRWEGKLKHKGIEVAPFGSQTTEFLAVITRSGIFDLKR